jgi:uncharacterized 2Fe-2S/4Fe-4S cluster protein (DUF4445 family)
VILAGNTVMTHLFLGWGGEGLERAPFQSPFQHRGWLPFNPGILGLNDHCTCELVPILSGFIGGDTTAAIIAADLDNKKSQRLLIDVGTNGEIVLSQNGTLYAVSTAAGPAFEGVGMHSGMPALKGAIEGISPNGEPLVIGGGSALGFCGSGYISCIDFLRKKGILSPAGLLRENEDKKRSWSPYKNNEPMITQDDIRKFQLAKSALAAGSEILFRETGISAEELAEITITGAFGNRIDPKSAVKIGLLPYIPQERITFIDNAAGRGAALCLGKSYFKERALTLQQTVKVLNLGEHPAFQEVFIKNMSFPLIE